MSHIPTDTRPSPDQAHLRSVMRQLAELESPDAPVLSMYVDMRPEAQGGDPGNRNELVVVRDRLREIVDGYPPHTTAGDSVRADAARFARYLDEEADALTPVEGLALFACDRAGVWQPILAPTPFETQISAGPTAELFQMAGLLEESRTAVVAVVDTNTCRLYVTRRGALLEGATLDEPTAEHERHDQGGWSQARYQRHIDMQDRRFAAEAAEAIAELVDRVRARHLLLAGDERALSVLEPALPEATRARLDHVERISLHADRAEVEAEVAPVLDALRRAEAQDAADRTVAGWRAGDLGLVGVDRVLEALERGQVHELVVDEEAGLDETLRAELVRLAALTAAEVVTVHDHEELRRLGGIGATLRYRL